MSDKKQNRVRLERKNVKQAERRRPHVDKYENRTKTNEEAHRG